MRNIQITFLSSSVSTIRELIRSLLLQCKESLMIRLRNASSARPYTCSRECFMTTLCLLWVSQPIFWECPKILLLQLLFFFLSFLIAGELTGFVQHTGSVSPICTTAAETRSRSQTPQRKKTPEIPRPLPPQLSSADHQSITLEWVGCPVGLCYHLEMAPKKSGSEKGPFKRSVSPGSPLRSVTPEPPSDWVAVYCGKDCNYKVSQPKLHHDSALRSNLSFLGDRFLRFICAIFKKSGVVMV